MSAMQAQTIKRSRPGAATGVALSTLPGERCVLPVVRSADVVPREAERVDVALHGVSQRETIRGRMARVLQMERLRGTRVDAHRTLRRHVDERRRFDRPLHATALEGNRRRFEAQELANE